MKNSFFPRALAIGVLTSNRRGGVTAHLCGLDVPSDRVPLLGAMWSGAMVRCHCWVPLGVSAHVGRLDVPCAMVRWHCWGGVIARWRSERGAIAGCHVVRFHCWVPLLDAIGGGWLGHTLTDWPWCHCWVPCGKVPLLGAIAGCNRRGVVMTHFDRLDVVPLLGAMVRCHCWVPRGVMPLLGVGCHCCCHSWMQ